MAKYLLDSPHTDAECMMAMDEIAAGTRGPELLMASHFGCESGVHNLWAVVDAESEPAARNMLPPFLRNKARVVQVSQQTPESIRRMHKM